MSIDRCDRARLIEAWGTPYEIGFQLGRFGAEAAHSHLTGTQGWAAAARRRDDEQVVRMADRVRDGFPDIFAEIEGLADGLELPFADVFAWNCRGDIRAMAPDGCTTVQLPGPCIVVAHNEDSDPGFRDHWALVRVRPASRPGFTGFAYPASILGHTFAANEAGLVSTVNNIRSLEMGDGLPRMVLTRAVLDCDTLDAALALLRETPRAGAFHLTLAQAGDTRLYSVEFTGARCSVAPVEVPSLHANHLVHPGMADEPQVITASSACRQRRGDALVAQDATSGHALAILRDTGGDGLPIRRDDPHDPDDENTLATAVFSIVGANLDWSVHDATSELARFHVQGRSSPAA